MSARNVTCGRSRRTFHLPLHLPNHPRLRAGGQHLARGVAESLTAHVHLDPIGPRERRAPCGELALHRLTSRPLAAACRPPRSQKRGARDVAAEAYRRGRETRAVRPHSAPNVSRYGPRGTSGAIVRPPQSCLRCANLHQLRRLGTSFWCPKCCRKGRHPDVVSEAADGAAVPRLAQTDAIGHRRPTASVISVCTRRAGSNGRCPLRDARGRHRGGAFRRRRATVGAKISPPGGKRDILV